MRRAKSRIFYSRWSYALLVFDLYLREGTSLHRSFAYAKSAVGIDVLSVHKLFAYSVVSTVSTDIVSSHTK